MNRNHVVEWGFTPAGEMGRYAQQSFESAGEAMRFAQSVAWVAVGVSAALETTPRNPRDIYRNGDFWVALSRASAMLGSAIDAPEIRAMRAGT